MQFVLEPPNGVLDIRLGVTLSAVAEVLWRYGDIEEFQRTPEAPPGWVARGDGVTIFVYSDSAGMADAIEFARPTDPTTDQVTFGGVNLFAEPADTVVELLTRAGVRLHAEEGGRAYTAPDLLISFWRDGGPEGPDGLPVYWESVLVARPGYYD
ncbi:MAG TPA: hypothetical protein VFZ97_08365 [Acidimicrobiales bacterium]